MSIAGLERRRSHRIRLADLDSRAVWKREKLSYDAKIVDFSAEGFLIEVAATEGDLPEQGELLVWGQSVWVEKRYERVDGNLQYVGLQRLEFNDVSAENTVATPNLSRQHYRMFALGPALTAWKVFAAIMLVAAGIAWFAPQFSVSRSDSERPHATAGFYDQLRHARSESDQKTKAQIVSAGARTPTPTRARSGFERRTLSSTSIPFHSLVQQLDLGRLSGEEVRHYLRDALKNNSAALFCLSINVANNDRESVRVELLCPRGVVQHLLDDLTVAADDWSGFRQSVAKLITRTSGGAGGEEAALVWHGLRLHQTSAQSLRLEFA